MTADNQDRLLVIWTSGDREVALNMVFMYSLNSRLRDWWKEVTLLVWGPADKLLTEDAELQEHIARMREAGLRVIACKACAERYDAVEALERVGVEVFYTGQFLTDWLKSGSRVITF